MTKLLDTAASVKIDALILANRDGLERRLWPKVDKMGPTVPRVGTPCWVWTACKNRRGYGLTAVGKKTVAAHRASYVLASGATGGLFVLHRCDVPACVRPDHLFLGTQAENMADMIAKGRSVRGDALYLASHPEERPRGETQWKAKLTDEAVRMIRAASRLPGFDAAKVALQLGVHPKTVVRVATGKAWRHVA